VVEHRQPACVSRVNRDPRWFGEVEASFTTRSLLCVPLLHNGRVLGVLEILNKKDPHGFNHRDITRLSAFAASATIAIENARLFSEASQARQLRALNDIALALSGSLNLENILNTSLDKTLAMLNAQGGVIGLRDSYDPSERLTIRVSRGLEPAESLRHFLTGALKEAGLETFILNSTPAANDIGQADLATLGIETLAAAPITAGSKVQGVLAVFNSTPHIYTTDEISLLSSIARIVGLAAQNAIHYNHMQTQATQLTYLNEVGSALTSSLDLAHVLKVIIEGVNSLLETERTSVFLIDTETNELVLRYTTEGDTEIRLPAPWQGIVGWVATHDEPALVNDPLQDPRHLRQVAVATGYAAHSILCVPLKVEGQVIGVIEVLNKTGEQQFNYQHQVLLTELTNWAAIALRNAHLFDQRVQAYQRLAAEQQRRIAAETRGAMAAVVLNMAHTMNNVIGAIRVWATGLEQTAITAPEMPLASFSDELQRIRKNAEEAIKLISNMTDPLEEVAQGPTDVHEYLARAVQSCWWPDNVRLQREYQPHLSPVRANAQRLEAIFHNLISNAIQALTERGGMVRLVTRQATGGPVEIVVADNGPGIPPELQERVFNPGVSGKHGGLGLGLWLAESFVHQFEGEITFTSSPAKGTAFVVTLQPMNVETLEPSNV
jgi:GAF domain-containing protein/two-component sensor histidine kinase